MRKDTLDSEFTKKVKNAPCYVGWVILKILSNGDIVSPCVRIPNILGNIYKDDFQKIWFSDKYAILREKIKSLPREDYCLNSCPYFSQNILINDGVLHNTIRRHLYKIFSKCLQFRYYIKEKLTLNI